MTEFHIQGTHIKNNHNIIANKQYFPICSFCKKHLSHREDFTANRTLCHQYGTKQCSPFAQDKWNLNHPSKGRN